MSEVKHRCLTMYKVSWVLENALQLRKYRSFVQILRIMWSVQLMVKCYNIPQHLLCRIHQQLVRRVLQGFLASQVM